QWVTSGLAALGVATAPLWAVCFAAARGERPRRVEMTGLVVGFAGIVLLNAGTDLAATPLGGVLLLGASMLWGTGSMWSRGRDLPPGPMSAAAEMLGGGTLMALVSLGLGERITAVPGPRALLAFSYLVVFGSIVAFSA